jgi:DeoR/GlpR family transcriptional regulator of sugar metabolism
MHVCATCSCTVPPVTHTDPLPHERQKLIVDRIARDGRVLAVDLAEAFGASLDTIRRDLRELAAAGLCQRVYGGALPVSAASGTLAERELQAPARKAALGRAAAGLVAAGSVVFIDAGSTNRAIAEALPGGREVTVVTSAPSIAAALAGRPGIELVVIGGRIHPRIGAAVGARAVRDVREIRVSLAFLGACAVDAGAGVAAFDPEDAEFKRAVAASADAVAVAVTADKLGTAAPFVVMPAERLAHLITEAGTPPAALAPFAALGVRLHRAPATEVRP